MMACCTKPETGIHQLETADFLIELTGDVEGVLSDTVDIVVSAVQGATRIDYHKDELIIDVDAGTIGVKFAQEDSGKFSPGSVAVQVNILYGDGRRVVSESGVFAIYSNLYREVME